MSASTIDIIIDFEIDNEVFIIKSKSFDKYLFYNYITFYLNKF